MLPTILLVEDEETDVFFLRKAFAKLDLKNPLHVANDGAQAREYFEGAGPYADRGAYPLPYLTLLDLKLPRMMGLDVLKWLRQQSQFRSSIIVVLTSSVDPSDIDAAYALGANGYLVKPADASKLVAIAQSIEDFWLTHNRPASPFTDLRH